MKLKLERFLNVFTKISFSFFFVWIFIMLIGFSYRTYPLKRTFILSNITILVIILFFFLFMMLIHRNTDYKKKKKTDYDKIVKIMFIAFIPIQIFLFYNGFFETDWDPGNTIIPTARAIIDGGKINNFYYSIYSNNLLITSFFALILKISKFINPFGNDLMNIVVINSIISSVSSYLVYKIGCKLLNKKYAFIGYIISIFVLVLSPWNMIYYSDSLGLLFPILIFYLYLSNINRKVKWPLISFISYIAYLIKPQSSLIFFALVVVGLVRNFDINKYKKLIPSVLISLGLILGLHFSLNQLYKIEGFKFNDKYKINFTHYLYIGANDMSSGLYNETDFSKSIMNKNSRERTKNNLDGYFDRVKDYGVVGYFNFLSKKILVNFNDGTFAWGTMGLFYYKVSDSVTPLSSGIRDIYYNYGKYYKQSSTLQHMIWILIITLITMHSIFSIIDLLKKKKINYNELVIILTLVFVVIFQLLFEGRARYLYVNMPLFILMMLYGLKDINSIKIKNKKVK